MNMALGGVYLIGGVARAMMPYLKDANFKKIFMSVETFRNYEKNISSFDFGRLCRT